MRHWLFMSEPGCFSFADLASAPGRSTVWDGVRNFQARNFLRDDIRVGDGVLYYQLARPEQARRRQAVQGVPGRR